MRYLVHLVGVDRLVQCQLIGVSHLRSRYPKDPVLLCSVYNTNLMTSVMRPDPRYELALQWHRKCRILRQSTPIRRRWQSQLEVTQCHSTGTIRKPGCNFLFAFHFHSNYGSVLHYFRDKARYWSKIVNFSYPLVFDTPVRGVPVGILLCRLAWKN